MDTLHPLFVLILVGTHKKIMQGADNTEKYASFVVVRLESKQVTEKALVKCKSHKCGHTRVD